MDFGNFGSTWWCKKWLEALLAEADANAVATGMRYATRGQVTNLDIVDNRVISVVKGPNGGLHNNYIVFPKFSPEKCEELTYIIIVLTQGFVNGVIDGTVKDPKALFLQYISTYKDIDKEKLRANMKAFLDDVIPTCEKYNVNLCVHPDDPPYPVLGMPRIIGCMEDLEWLRKANPSIRNGITFCTGSLSGRPDNDLVAIAEKFADAIHFVHLRNTQHLDDFSFYESGHLKGSLDMPAIVEALLKEQHRRIKEGRKDIRMPFRPDHGIRILNDLDADKNIYNAGYPLCGRMRGLAEIAGLMTGIEYNMK